MRKISEVKKFKESLKNQSGSQTNAQSAEQAVKNLSNAILNKEDLFLFCASLNYLNAYIKSGSNKNKELANLLKQEFPTMKFKNGYGFKKFVNIALIAILDKDFKGVTFRRFPNENGLVMITIDGLQFSYHGVGIYSSIIEDVKKEENKAKSDKSKKVGDKDWEGLRLQPVAQNVFDFASDLEGLSGVKYYELDSFKAKQRDQAKEENNDEENE